MVMKESEIRVRLSVLVCLRIFRDILETGIGVIGRKMKTAHAYIYILNIYYII